MVLVRAAWWTNSGNKNGYLRIQSKQYSQAFLPAHVRINVIRLPCMFSLETLSCNTTITDLLLPNLTLILSIFCIEFTHLIL